MTDSWRAYKKLMQTVPYLFDNQDALFFILTDEEEILRWQKEKKASLPYIPPAWLEIGVVFDDPSIVILRDLVEFPGGYRNGYIRIYNRAYLDSGAAGVAVLPVKEDKILLIRHYRHATRSHHWEIPRGFGKPGITAELQAINEIKEEIEGEIKSLVSLGVLYNNTGLEGNPIYLFLAHLASIGNTQIQEGIENARWVSACELEQMIADNQITDGFTLAAYARAKTKGLI